MSTTAGKKIAIVTGSALGLGYELARQLIDRGWFVAGIDFNAQRQAELSQSFGKDEYRAFVGDVSDESFVKNSIAAIRQIEVVTFSWTSRPGGEPLYGKVQQGAA